MKIKKLEILGFKSFIDKSTLTFPKGITAVVGPNGSGKSNIVDAIKWALGEQSIKSLRGKAMEDIIFNGSGDKKPLGMAEVTLTFTNADSGISYKYSKYHEITVRRRVYRSGESEYFLNKTLCRLKDINDLFMGTGVGTKTYSIIAQGQIESIISARPTDRRAFIEEAAGITKYKSKKVEAVRKIESTRNNLLRISDIVGEVNRQMDSLALQAKKAEEFKELKEGLKRNELIDGSRNYLRLKEEIETENERLMRKEEEEAVAEGKVSIVEGKIEELKTLSLEKEEAFDQIQKRFYSNETDARTIEESIKYLKDRIESTKQRNEMLDKERTELVGFILETTKRAEDLTSRIYTAQVETDYSKDNLNEIGARLSDITDIVEELTGKGEELQSGRLVGASRVSELKNNIDSAERLIERFTGLIAERERELESSKAEIVRIDKLISEKLSENENVEKEEKQCAERLSKAEKKVEELTQRDMKILKEREGVESSKARVETRLNTILEMEKNFEGLNEGVKEVMTGDREGVIGIFSDLIEVDEKHEKALEGFLGEAVSAVIVQGVNDAKRHIDRLKDDKSGRAVFIPIKDINENTSVEGTSLTDDGVVGRLKDSVRIKEKGAGEDIVSSFGNAHLVDTLDRALKIWEKRRPDFSIVTLDGEMVTPEGLIFGGSREGGFSVLKNKREREAFKREVGELAERLETIEGNLDETRQELASAKDNFKREEKNSTNITIKLQMLKREYEAAIGEKEKIDKAKGDVEIAIKKESDEIERLKSEREESFKALETAEEDDRGLKERDEALRLDLAEKRRKMKEIEEEETEVRLSLNKSLDQKEHLIESLEEQKRQVERSEKDRQNKTKNITDGELEIKEFEDKVSNSETELLEKIKAAKELEDELRDARADVDGGVLKEKEFDGDRKSQQKQLAVIKDDIQQMRDSAKELVWELEKLTTNISEKYKEDIEKKYIAFIYEKVEEKELRESIEKGKKKIDRFGEVNLLAISEFNDRKERLEFLQSQETDLLDSIDSLNKTIQKIDKKSKERFLTTFHEVNEKFQEVFPRLVPDGKAKLVLTDSDDPLESGVEIMAQPPGKRLSSITLLSGGEKALTAIALIFSIFIVKPTPFCMMDEVDAPLDDINIERFIELLKEISLTSQVILITHNKKTMEMADTLYGVTMEEQGVSKMVSVKLKDQGGISGAVH
jgi:chromosome segregation protein